MLQPLPPTGIEPATPTLSRLRKVMRYHCATMAHEYDAVSRTHPHEERSLMNSIIIILVN